jgi:RNA polymerase sigma-70 factor (ECF subfamily)
MHVVTVTQPIPFANSRGPDDADRALIADCAAGKRQAMEAIYRRYHRRVFGLVVRMVGPQEADEVAQDAFVRVFKGLKRFRGDAALSTWIYRVAMNTCLSSLSKGSRRAELYDQYVHERSPDQRAAQPMLRRRLEGALAKLPPGYRAVLLLHDVEGMNHQEIAQVLNWREGTSKSQLHKARMKMRGLLQPALGMGAP